MSHRYALLQAEAEILALEARAQAFIALGCDADAKAPKVDSPWKTNKNDNIIAKHRLFRDVYFYR